MIKAIIFDADGPLYHRTGDITSQTQALLEEYGYHGDIKLFDERYEKEKFKAYVAEETPAQMFQNILALVGVNISTAQAKEVANKFDAIHKQVTATPDAIATLRQLKAEGYLTCVLTDSFYSAEAKWPWFEQLGLKQYLDDMVSSLDIRKLKNTPEAYQACLDKLGVSADEAVFVGHQQYEMDGSKAVQVTSIAILPIATPHIRADYTINALSELSGVLKRINSVRGQV